MSAVAMWRIHRLAAMFHRYPHEIIPDLTPEQGVAITAFGLWAEERLRGADR